MFFFKDEGLNISTVIHDLIWSDLIWASAQRLEMIWFLLCDI